MEPGATEIFRLKRTDAHDLVLSFAGRRAQGQGRYRSPDRRCLNRTVETGMANRGQDHGPCRYWTRQCGRRQSRFLLLLLDFDFVAVGLGHGLTQLGSLVINPGRRSGSTRELETGN